MSDIVLRNAGCLGAALAGVLVASVYVRALWQATEATVCSRSLRPFVLGAVVRLVLLFVPVAMLVLLDAGPAPMLSFFMTFLFVRWLLVRHVREAPFAEREIA